MKVLGEFKLNAYGFHSIIALVDETDFVSDFKLIDVESHSISTDLLHFNRKYIIIYSIMNKDNYLQKAIPIDECKDKYELSFNPRGDIGLKFSVVVGHHEEDNYENYSADDFSVKKHTRKKHKRHRVIHRYLRRLLRF